MDRIETLLGALCAGATDPDEQRVFDRMLSKPYFGRVQFSHLPKMSPEDFPEGTTSTNKIRWFNDHRNKFAKFEGDDGRVAMFSIRILGAKLCMKYLGKENVAKEKSCDDADCRLLHLCQKYIGGFCRGIDCDLDHSFQSEHNRKVVKQLNLEKFGDDDLRRIVCQSQLHVCGYYNKDGSTCNHEDRCTRMHICEDLVKGSCTKEPCPKERSHRFGSPHSVRLLQLYGLTRDDIPRQETLDQLLIIKPGPQTGEQPSTLAKNIVASRLRKLFGEANIRHRLRAAAAATAASFGLSDSDDDAAIDELTDSEIVRATWEVEIFEDWISLNHATSRKIEEAYCDPASETFSIPTPDSLQQYFDDKTMKINFSKMVGELSDQVQEVQIRRVWTDKEDQLYLWYYQDKVWNPYSEEEQYILEASYQAKEKRAYVGRLDIYRIKFSDWTQKNRQSGKIRKICRRPIFL